MIDRANPQDPSELSFSKNEELEIIDRNGNWWKARKQDGSVGIVPSNYVSSSWLFIYYVHDILTILYSSLLFRYTSVIIEMESTNYLNTKFIILSMNRNLNLHSFFVLLVYFVVGAAAAVKRVIKLIPRAAAV